MHAQNIISANNNNNSNNTESNSNQTEKMETNSLDDTSTLLASHNNNSNNNSGNNDNQHDADNERNHSNELSTKKTSQGGEKKRGVTNHRHHYNSTDDLRRNNNSNNNSNNNDGNDNNNRHNLSQHQQEEEEHEEVSPSSSFSLFSYFHKLSRHAFGIFLIIIVAFIWVSSSEFLQYVFGSENFDKPYFVTYFNTMSFGLWMFGFACPVVSGFDQNPLWASSSSSSSRKFTSLSNNNSDNKKSSRRRTTTDLYDDDENVDDHENNNNNAADTAVSSNIHHQHHQQQQQIEMRTSTNLRESRNTNENENNNQDQEQEEEEEDESPPIIIPYSITDIAYAAFLFCPLWFLANVLFNYSLSRTSVASNTILSSTSTIWAMIFSRILLKEPVTPRKLIALAISFCGAIAVGFGDQNSNNENDDDGTSTGNILAGISAMFYAAYTTVLRHNLPDERRYPIGMCFAFVGVFNFVLLWPGLILLNLLGVESFEFPSGKVFGFLVLNGLVGTNLSDILWAKSVILTSPLIATLGLSLTIPVAMVADLLLRGKWHGWLYICGAISVTIGFVVANWKTDDDDEEDEEGTEDENNIDNNQQNAIATAAS